MVIGDMYSVTNTNMSNVVTNYTVTPKALDVANAAGEETYWYFTDATRNLGYYDTNSAINSAANALATWAVGRGWTCKNVILTQELKHVTGIGKDTFEKIMWNHLVMKLIVGDAFAEVIQKENKILNIIPISPERIRTVVRNNQIIRYDVWNGTKWKEIKKENMLHSMNKRIGDQIHGTSQINACKTIIDFHTELIKDSQKLQHRDMALGIAYYKTNSTGKITYANEQIEKAVKNGEMLGIPEDVLKIEGFPSKSTGSRLEFIQYCENFFYQTFGVPRTIATSDGVSEVGGKMGHVVFEPIYSKEQIDLEGDLSTQFAIDIKFNRPPSLGGLMQQEEAKNTGQINIQPNDVSATMERE